jgi:hypothetical protein
MLCFFFSLLLMVHLALQCIIDHQALPYLLNFMMTDQNKGIKREVCGIISNIMAGNKEQIQVLNFEPTYCYTANG